MLENVQTGVVLRPPKLLIYGAGGVGKSTCAAGAPNPLFLDTEGGVDELDVHKLPVDSFNHTVAALSDICEKDHEYQTLVVDSLSMIEGFITEGICNAHGVSSIGDISHGRGYVEISSWWRDILEWFDAVHEQRGMGVICIAHDEIEKVHPPDGAEYTRWGPRLDKRAKPLVCEWMDAVLFAKLAIPMMTEEMAFKAERQVVIDGEPKRLLQTRGVGAIAKSRYDMPREMPLFWESIEDRIPWYNQ